MINKSLDEIKEEIHQLDHLLSQSDKCQNVMDKNELIQKYERLSYYFYKSLIKNMRDFEGDGDGI